VEKYDAARQATDDNIIWRMHIARWVAKAADTHSEYVILIAFPQQEWLSEHASMLHYMRTACPVKWNVSEKLQLELNLQPHN
jgi:hypothetical protein